MLFGFRLLIPTYPPAGTITAAGLDGLFSLFCKLLELLLLLLLLLLGLLLKGFTRFAVS